MRKAQTRIALVLLAIVAVIALVGLVLLYTTPGATQYGIGEPYGSQPGIVSVQQLPQYLPYAPVPEFPASTTMKTIGSQTPVMLFFKGEYASIEDMGKCWSDLWPKMAAPKDAFDCYVVPSSGPAQEVKGFFWPSTSALPRPLYQMGGDILCYVNTPYDREALVDRLKILVEEAGWRVDKVNDKEVLVCSQGPAYIFPQGLR